MEFVSRRSALFCIDRTASVAVSYAYVIAFRCSRTTNLGWSDWPAATYTRDHAWFPSPQQDTTRQPRAVISIRGRRNDDGVIGTFLPLQRTNPDLCAYH